MFILSKANIYVTLYRKLFQMDRFSSMYEINTPKYSVCNSNTYSPSQPPPPFLTCMRHAKLLSDYYLIVCTVNRYALSNNE